MRCGVARKHLYRRRGQRFSQLAQAISAEVADAREHLAGCGACQRFFLAEEGLKTLLRSRILAEKAPAALRERVLSRIAREREQSASVSRWFAPWARGRAAKALLGLLVIVSVAGGLWFTRRGARLIPEELTSALVADHAHNLPAAMEIISSDQNAVQSWFRAKVNFTFRLPATRNPSLIGGRLCKLQGRPAALILYRHPANMISLFVLDGGDVELNGKNLIALDGKRCLLNVEKGYNVVLWKERGVLYGLVSDISSPDLLQMAEKF